jgi:hypothetical protein
MGTWLTVPPTDKGKSEVNYFAGTRLVWLSDDTVSGMQTMRTGLAQLADTFSLTVTSMLALQTQLHSALLGMLLESSVMRPELTTLTRHDRSSINLSSRIVSVAATAEVRA